MSCGSKYTSQLHERGYRMTPQRLAILHVLHHSDGHLSPAEVYALAYVDHPGLTETTVYRTLEFLSTNGFVQAAHKGNGHLTYEIARHDHHHLKCRNCGDEMEVQHELLQPIYRQLESVSGYRLTDSHLTFIGICSDCQKGD